MLKNNRLAFTLDAVTVVSVPVLAIDPLLNVYSKSGVLSVYFIVNVVSPRVIVCALSNADLSRIVTLYLPFSKSVIVNLPSSEESNVKLCPA